VRHARLARASAVYRDRMTATSRIPPPPMPNMDWSTSAAYLRSCHEWLDAMERWRSDELSTWIDRTRVQLIENALRLPERPVVAEPRVTLPRNVEKPRDNVAEFRLPAVD
jgi:hypothetical protein